MEKLNVEIEINDNHIESLTEAVIENIDIENKIESAIDDYDFDNKIYDWFKYNNDIESQIENVLDNKDLTHYINVDDLDFEPVARDLLGQYSPSNSCETSKAFTYAVQQAVRYLLLKNNDFVLNISNALAELERTNAMLKAKATLMEQVKNEVYEEFKSDLERYAKETQEKQLSAYGYSVPLDIV